jgi:signal transduction histidine kinase
LSDLRDYHGFLYAIATPLYATAVLFYLLFVLLSFNELVRYLRSVESYKKIQAQYLFYGFFIGFTGGTSLLLPEFYLDWLYPAGNAGVFIYAAIVTYAVLKDRILDVELHAQLAHRDKLAAMSTLVTSVNHEIRNPLYVIQGLADTHLTNFEEEIYTSSEQAIGKANEVLKKIREHATRAMEIMKRFTIFAKRGVSEKTNTEEVQLNEVLDNVLPLVRYEMELDQIQFSKNIPSGFFAFKADRRHIEEILFNLIVNACQAFKLQASRMSSSMAPKSAISISAEQRNGHIDLLIQDNGPGIPEGSLRQIFEPFYTTKEEGTGLGLYITKQLVEQNGGRISVQSKPGEGTSFHLRFKR